MPKDMSLVTQKQKKSFLKLSRGSVPKCQTQAKQQSSQKVSEMADQFDNVLQSIRCTLNHVCSLRDEKASRMLRACVTEIWNSPDLSKTIFNVGGRDTDELITDDELCNLLLTPSLREVNFSRPLPPIWTDNVNELRWKCGLIGRGGPAFDTGLELLQKAALATIPTVTRNADEYVFQMEARLRDMETHHWIVRRYLQAIKRLAPTPRLHPAMSCFSPPFGRLADCWRVTFTIIGITPIEANGIIAIVAAANSLHFIRDNSEIACFSTVPRPIACIASSDDGLLLAAALEDGLMIVWNAQAGRVVATMAGDGGQITSAAVSRGGGRLLAIRGGGTVQTWELPGGRCISHAKLRSNNALLPGAEGAVIVNDGQHVAICDMLGMAGMLNASTGEHVSSLFPLGFIPTVAAGCGGVSQAVWGGDDGNIIVAEACGDAVKCTRLLGHHGGVTAVYAVAEGHVVISGAADGAVRIWDVAAGGAPRIVLNGHRAAVSAVAIRGNGRAVSAAADGEVRAWTVRALNDSGDVQRGRHGDAVLCVSVSADGTRVVSGARDGTVLVWDTREGTAPFFAVQAHDKPVTHVETWGFDLFSTFSGANSSATWVMGSDGVQKVQDDILCKTVETEKDSPHEGNTSSDNLFRLQSDLPTTAKSFTKQESLQALGTRSGWSRVPPVTTWACTAAKEKQHAMGASASTSASIDKPLRKVPTQERCDSDSSDSDISKCNSAPLFESVHIQRRRRGQTAALVKIDGQRIIHRQNGRILGTLPCRVATSCAWCVSDDQSLLIVGLSNGEVLWFNIEN